MKSSIHKTSQPTSQRRQSREVCHAWKGFLGSRLYLVAGKVSILIMLALLTAAFAVHYLSKSKHELQMRPPGKRTVPISDTQRVTA